VAEMTRRERILASAHKQRADRIPFFHYWRHCQTGWAERECRNRGMGMNWLRPPHVTRLHGVDVTEAQAVVEGRSIVRRTYTTPVGSVYEEEYREPGTGHWRRPVCPSRRRQSTASRLMRLAHDPARWETGGARTRTGFSRSGGLSLSS
jgi:hypothetical protein